MVSVPTFTSRTFSEPATGKVLRASEMEVQQWAEIGEATGEELSVSSSHLQISEEAYDQLERDRQVQAIEDRRGNSGRAIISRSEAMDVPAPLQSQPGATAAQSVQDRIQREIEERYGVLAQGNADVRSSTHALGLAYDSLMAQVNQQRPGLGNSAFGFSVNAEGRLVLFNTQGLKDEEFAYLNDVLNGSQALVEKAVDLANAHITLAASQPWTRNLMLSRQNYAQTIDLGADLLYNRQARALPRGTGEIPAKPVDLNNYWRFQLEQKR